MLPRCHGTTFSQQLTSISVPAQRVLLREMKLGSWAEKDLAAQKFLNEYPHRL
jgi:hypothetical protein